MSLHRIQYRQFSKYRKIRYRRIYGNSNRGEPKKMPKSRTKMFVPTHIAHAHDWSPVDRIWGMRVSRHDVIDEKSFTSLVKETVSSVDLLDVIGLSLRKPHRQIDWKPYHSAIAIHHLAQINTNDGDATLDYASRYLADLIEECAISMNVLKPRFIAQTMWSLDKLNLINHPQLKNRGKLCLLKCADSLASNPLMHKLEIWNVADCVSVMTKNKLFNHPLIASLAQRIICLHSNNEWFGINDIGQSYSILAHSFGKIAQFRTLDNEHNGNDNEHNIDYKSLAVALMTRFMDDRIYSSSNNFEILNLLNGIGQIMQNNEDKLCYDECLKNLENDLYANIDSMHARDIGIISNAFLNCCSTKDLLSKSLWFGGAKENIFKYLDNMIKQDAFSLLDIDECIECLHFFLKILLVFIGDDGKKSAYYQSYCAYMDEIYRCKERFIEQYDGKNETKYGAMMNEFIQIFADLTKIGNLRDDKYFLFEQKFAEILCVFLQSDSSLFDKFEWKSLISLQSNIHLLNILLAQNKESKDLNINVLKAVFASIEYHILNNENAQSQIENDRILSNNLYELIGLFYVCQTQNPSLFMADDDDNNEQSAQMLISEDLRNYFADLLMSEYLNKMHILAQSDRKCILRNLLILNHEKYENLNDFFDFLLDRNKFEFYKGTMSALLTQIIDDKMIKNGHLFGKAVKSKKFTEFLDKNGLFLPSAFVCNDENVYQAKHLNEWRFERLKEHKMVAMEEWAEDAEEPGFTRGPLWELRKGKSREGAGIHPTLNDFVDLQKLEEDEDESTVRGEIVSEEDVYEDYSLLMANDEVNCKKIILRSLSDALVEYKQRENDECVAMFVHDGKSKLHQEYFAHLSDLFGAKHVVVKSNSDANELCNRVQSLL